MALVKTASPSNESVAVVGNTKIGSCTWSVARDQNAGIPVKILWVSPLQHDYRSELSLFPLRSTPHDSDCVIVVASTLRKGLETKLSKGPSPTKNDCLERGEHRFHPNFGHWEGCFYHPGIKHFALPWSYHNTASMVYSSSKMLIAPQTSRSVHEEALEDTLLHVVVRRLFHRLRVVPKARLPPP